MRDRIPEELPTHLLFYDGVCAMCNGIVKAMLRLDRDQVFVFAPLQGETAARARALHPEFPSTIETLVYLRGGQLFVRSRAAALAMAELPYPVKALSWFRCLPIWLTDPVYNLVARIRYRLFGRYDHCPLPPEADRARFLP
jgi:predicted DCC family thiol-disulfide oxidoreductase YuxK